MSRSILFFLFYCFSFYSFSQDLTCDDFKEGVFSLIVEEPIRMEFEVTRKGNEQVEKIVNVPKGLEKYLEGKPKSIYATIKWIDNCRYNLMYDTTKGENDETSKLVNENGGVNTEVTKIEGRCFFYKSSMKVNGIEQVINGKLCKKE